MTPLQTLIRPRSVFCVTDHTRRNLALAEDVCKGRFTHAGLTLELGLDPDWLRAGNPNDAEWHIEWSKFYYGLDMAHAYQQTGDPRFLHCWERLVDSWIRKVPVGFDTSDVIARRVQNWIYAWDLFAQQDGFDGLGYALDERLAASIAAQIALMRNRLTPARNHRTLELYSLFITALALPELDPEKELLDFAIRELHENLRTDIRPDGVHCEHSTHYHMTVLRSFVGALENARRFNLKFSDAYRERLERACEFAMHCHRPDGQIPAISDSDTGNYADLLQLAGRLLGRPDFLYAATQGREGVPPRQSAASFPHGGYFVQRSGWGTGPATFEDEKFLIFDCGSIGDGGHGHYDLLSVEISADGGPLIVDPGRYTYAENTPNFRRWFKGTAAHNTVCVDGLDQTPYRNGRPKGPAAAGRLAGRWAMPGLDVLCGEAISPAYDAVHTRTIFFVAEEYWLIVDDLRAARPHRYDLRFHLAPEFQNQLELSHATGSSAVHSPRLAMVFHADGAPAIEEGWVSHHYGEKVPAPVITVVVPAAVETRYVTCVFPHSASERVPSLHLDCTTAETRCTLRMTVHGVGADGRATDTLVWSDGAELLTIGDYKCRARVAWLRRTSSGAELALRACDLRELASLTTGETLYRARPEESARCMIWNPDGLPATSGSRS